MSDDRGNNTPGEIAFSLICCVLCLGIIITIINEQRIRRVTKKAEIRLAEIREMPGYGYKDGENSLFTTTSGIGASTYEWMFVVQPCGKFVFNSDNGEPITLTGNQVYEIVKKVVK